MLRLPGSVLCLWCVVKCGVSCYLMWCGVPCYVVLCCVTWCCGVVCQTKAVVDEVAAEAEKRAKEAERMNAITRDALRAKGGEYTRGPSQQSSLLSWSSL